LHDLFLFIEKTKEEKTTKMLKKYFIQFSFFSTFHVHFTLFFPRKGEN